MDIGSNKSKVTSDDQELAKVLAGINEQADQASDTLSTPTPPTPAPSPVTEDKPKEEPASPMPTPSAPQPSAPEPTPEPSSAPTSPPPVPTATGDLSEIKKGALTDLLPLVDKLTLAPEEMYDTYLLLIRSTDDQKLIEPAYKAAQGIADENRKAQALLDIVKEIDYLSNLNK